MPRNQFKDEDEHYVCPRCVLGLHDMCSEPGVCQCSFITQVLYVDGVPYRVVHEFPAGKPEDEDSGQEVDNDPHNWPAIGEVSLAELRRSGQSTTDAHRKTAT